MSNKKRDAIGDEVGIDTDAYYMHINTGTVAKGYEWLDDYLLAVMHDDSLAFEDWSGDALVIVERDEQRSWIEA